MHSSRMRTAGSLTVSHSMHCAMGGGGAWSWRGVPGLGGVCSGGCLLQRGVCSGDGITACTEAEPPPVDRMTEMCKNITFPKTSFTGGKKRNGSGSEGPLITF